MMIATVLCLISIDWDWQRSGGRMGGSSSGSSSSSSSSRSSSSSSSRSSSSSSSSSGGGGGDGLGAGGAIFFALFFILLFSGGGFGILGVIIVLLHPSPKNPKGTAAASERRDTTAISIAVDWRSRKEVQGALSSLAREADTSTTEGLLRIVRGTTEVLLKFEEHWAYAGALNHSVDRGHAEAETLFRKAATEAAARYDKEVIRNLRGAKSQGEATGTQARPDEGPGLVVVTLVVSARREIPDVRDVRDPFCLRAALESLGKLMPGELVSVEVIWSPAEENDRLSSAELEILYPELKRLQEGVGLVHCPACGTARAAELTSCPACGGIS